MGHNGQWKSDPIALIVEDDAELRDLAAALLEETSLRVMECENAEEAFATVCKHGNDIALIFADVRLPGLLDGVEFARRVRVLWPNIPIIVTSGYPAQARSLPEDVVYMPKPWLALDVLVQAEHAATRIEARRRAS
jgi:CheY-like chemotaxis protein